jgi:hypothetical protein
MKNAAKTNGGGLPAWPRYSTARGETTARARRTPAHGAGGSRVVHTVDTLSAYS